MLPDVAALTDVLTKLRVDGYNLTRGQVARPSPYIRAHLKRFGQYVLDMYGHEPKPLNLVKEESPLR